MSEERVSIEVSEHVATVTMLRADKHNALDLPMFDALTAAIARVSTESGIRAVVLHGAGKSFCSGIDIMSLASAAPDGSGLTDPLSGPVPNRFQQVAYGWITVPVPVIAAIHGNCFGGGLQIALGADIRIATADAKLSVMEVKWGLIPDMGITRTLPRLVAIDVAKELTYTGRVISGTEAAALGLVTRVADHPLLAAQQLAAEIASRSPDAVRRAKRLYEQSWTGADADTLALEAELQLELIGSPNQLAAVTAGLTKEPAQFTDPV